ncbi:ABC transporter permease subunit [Saccharibacillus alkalitolerans]|uniref:ABC transporter permease n=1 Tax=Saccharibacillus alkalitolerans TaxID=2705290 RepID=A0ABX0FEC0_9BACL|nr:ABC transporter permease subunit [Saccharibacillus alkalitolerans]NGZ77607.1 ABC transporter permease [Saccharibacillus alkalitolerans]
MSTLEKRSARPAASGNAGTEIAADGGTNTGAAETAHVGRGGAKAGKAAAGEKGGAGPTFGAMIARTTEVELRKILAQFKYRALPVLIALVPLAVMLLNRSGGIIRLSAENLPYTLLSLAAYILLPLAACMLAADLFAGERERGELKIALTRPVSRPALAIGRIGAMLLYQAGLLAALLILSLAAAFLSGAVFGELNLPAVLGAYAVTMLPAAAVSAAAAFASTLARSATSGFLLGILLLAVMGGAALAFPAVSPVMLTEYATLYKSVIGSEIAFGQLALGAGILLGSFSVLTAAQILLFDGKEI